MQPPEPPQLNINSLRAREEKIQANGENRVLPLKYLPLAWVAVLLTGLTGILIAMGVDFHNLAKLLNLTSSWALSLMIYSTYQLITVLLLIYLLRGAGITLRDIGFKGAPKKYYAFALVLVLASSLIWAFCDFIVSQLGLSMWWSKEAPLTIKTPSDFIVLLVCPVFLCATLEEILYRGYILTAIMRRVNMKTAFIINSLIFASIHYAFGPGTMLFIFFWTFIPCWLYYKSGSIYPSILFHSVNNLLAYVILPLTFQT